MVWQRIMRYKLRRTDIILALCVSFLLGLVIARTHMFVPLWVVVMLGVAVVLLARNRAVQLIVAVLFGMGLGVWRGGEYLTALQPYQTYAREKITIQARATLDAIYGNSGQLSFEVSDITFVSPEYVVAPGVMKVSGYGELAVYRGDVVEITGKLYPTRGGKQAVMGYAQIERIGNEQTFIDVLRRKFAAGMQTALPEPLASFALGLLVGQRNTLPQAVSDTLLMVGLTHIIAVSGYNLTVMLNAAKRLTGKRSKRFTVLLGGGLMLFFLLFAGSSPSIVRAAVVSGLSLAAWYYGRTVRPMVLLLLAAAITTYATPVYFWSDISWWLSTLAFFGILVIAPQVLHRLYPKKEPPMLSQVAVETLSAELMTIPIIMFIFGQVSLVGLVANVLVATAIPIAMLLSFAAGLVGMLAPLLVGWIAWPAVWLLTYMLDTAALLSRIPNIFHTNVYLSVTDMVLCYVVIVAFALLLQRRKTTWFATVEAEREEKG